LSSLIIHGLLAVALLGRSHQAFSVARRDRRAGPIVRQVWPRQRRIVCEADRRPLRRHSIGGGLLYPQYRPTRPALEDLSFRAANGIFEIKEHLIAVGLYLADALAPLARAARCGPGGDTPLPHVDARVPRLVGFPRSPSEQRSWTDAMKLHATMKIFSLIFGAIYMICVYTAGRRSCIPARQRVPPVEPARVRRAAHPLAWMAGDRRRDQRGHRGADPGAGHQPARGCVY
jgi:hypothetical protein